MKYVKIPPKMGPINQPNDKLVYLKTEVLSIVVEYLSKTV